MNGQLSPWFKHYDLGVPQTIGTYPEGTLLEAIDEALAARPHAPAFLYKGRAMSWRELADASDAFAMALAEMGVKSGDRVACLLPNCPQFFIAELATWKLRATYVPLNPIYTEDELAGPLETTGSTVVVTLSAFYERMKSVQRRVPAVKHVIATNIKEWFPPLLKLIFTLAVEKKMGHRATLRDGDQWLPALIARHQGTPMSRPRPTADDDALLLMSGGTTGTPKAVRIHHGALVQTGTQVNAWLGSVLPKWEGVYCLPLPMFHSYGACGVQSVCFLGHNPIALVPNPRDIDDLVKTIESTMPAVFCGVPSLYNSLLNHKRVQAGKVNFKSMKACVSGAAPMMLDTMKRFEAVTGARILEGYALTESALAATVSPLRGLQKPGSVGTPLPDVDLRIVDADDPSKLMPFGEVGEILLRGPQIMRGYWKNDAETRAMLRVGPDGHLWLFTADLGYIDEDGYVFIVDRKKDLIKMRGMQVWPREIEEVIATHPAVLEVGVRGFPDAGQGEVAVAFVVRRVGQTITAEQVRQWCKERMAPFKVPVRVVFKDELPKSMIGKILRRLLTEDEVQGAKSA
jgi:long-chain acyl-CoA synthetase